MCYFSLLSSFWQEKCFFKEKDVNRCHWFCLSYRLLFLTSGHYPVYILLKLASCNSWGEWVENEEKSPTSWGWTRGIGSTRYSFKWAVSLPTCRTENQRKAVETEKPWDIIHSQLQWGSVLHMYVPSVKQVFCPSNANYRLLQINDLHLFHIAAAFFPHLTTLWYRKLAHP